MAAPAAGCSQHGPQASRNRWVSYADEPCGAVARVGQPQVVVRWCAPPPTCPPTGLASRFDNGNPHGFSGFVEANFGRFCGLRVLAAGAFCVYRLKSSFEAALRKKRRLPPNIDKNRCIPSRLPRYARLGRPGG